MGNNVFIPLPSIPAGASGPQAPVFLPAFAPPTGLDPDMTLYCVGEFDGIIGIEGSSDGVVWDVIEQFDAGRDSDGASGPMLEFSPKACKANVTYVRANVKAVVKSQTNVFVAGQQNCATCVADALQILEILFLSSNLNIQYSGWEKPGETFAGVGMVVQKLAEWASNFAADFKTGVFGFFFIFPALAIRLILSSDQVGQAVRVLVYSGGTVGNPDGDLLLSQDFTFPDTAEHPACSFENIIFVDRCAPLKVFIQGTATGQNYTARGIHLIVKPGQFF